MSAKTANPADVLLRKLRKEQHNMSCPNCGSQAQAGIGFGNVCVKFKTFICDNCKTSHQAISHRVKSVTMSNWTMEEVHELLDSNCGGNLAALHVWLQNAPPIGGRYAGGSRPKAGDRIEVFKQFVMDCYEYGKFKATSPYQPSAGDFQSHSPVSPKPQPIQSTASFATQPPRIAATTAPAPQTVNLLEVDDFFSSSSNTSPKPISTTVTPTTSVANDFGNFANFSSFSSTQQTQSTSMDFDPFGNASTTTTSNTAHKQSFTAINGNNVQHATSQSNISEFDFFNMSAPTTSAFQQPAPVPVQPPMPVQNSAPAFDPFGSNVLIPTTVAPAAQPNPNVFGFGQQTNIQAQNNSMHGMGNSSYQQQPQASANRIMDMYSQVPNNNYQQRPMGSMNAPHAAFAISQIDVFSGQPNARPMGGMPYNGAQAKPYAMQAPPVRMPTTATQQNNNSFDFLQDTMRKHLDNPSSGAGGYHNNGMRQPPQHPFR